MPRPSISALPPALAGAARAAAQTVRAAGARAWIVGGAVRDLALGRAPHDLDLASRLPPEALEGRFATTAAVGRAFGTLVVVVEGVAMQHTTFRSEEGYSDARRPDRVRYGATLQEDASRRDFTCNALYLDPLTDELADPVGGLADLEAGLLRCVGEPLERLREDGLRILRLARFAAGYGLAVDGASARAVPGALDALRGVSAERVAGELARLTERPGSARAAALLEDLGALAGLLERFGAPTDAVGRARRVAVLARLEEPVAQEELLAVLLGGAGSALESALDALRPSRALRAGVLALARDADAALALARAPGDATRAGRIRLVRAPSWTGALRVARAVAHGDLATAAGLERLASFAAALGPDERHPAPLLSSADLAARGLAPGPRWGELLREAEERQLEGELATREQALAWLARRAGAG